MDNETKERFYALCDEHLKHARVKHPEFAERVCIEQWDNVWAFTKSADEFRELAGKDKDVMNIVMSEVCEFLAELQRGDKTRAREEAADVVAVLLRALDGDHMKEVQA